ncbi:DUF1868 domain-containing protein [Vibrio minamisatsumaniensis]|uniref:DUF1868 domain-containing protein n=1 Tax=Vibrio minamisatsumaniensis TaxID=2910243 RepID=UPI003D1B6AA7
MILTRSLERTELGSKVLLLPPNTYHFTVFGGINEKSLKRGMTGKWRDDIGKTDIELDDVNRSMIEKIYAAIDSGNLHVPKIKFKVVGIEGTFGIMLSLEPSTKADLEKFTELSYKLSEITGIKLSQKQIENLGNMHMTMAYAYKELTDQEKADIDDYVNKHGKGMIGQEVIVDSIEYSIFDDMLAFPTVIEVQ